MRGFSLVHLSDTELRHDLSRVVVHERSAVADVISHIAEYQSRRLYSRDGYPNMTAYCMKVLHYSEDAAWRRTNAATMAARYPIVLSMLADGRLHLTAVCLLAPHLTPVNADELLEAAKHRSRKQIEKLLAERFPRPDVPSRIEPVPSPETPTLFDGPDVAPSPASTRESIVEVLPTSAPARKHFSARQRVRALAPHRFAVQVTIDEETHDLLRYAQDLLSHQIPGSEIAAVLKRVLETAIPVLEKRKFAATNSPRRSAIHPGGNQRRIPRPVKRAVWKRDGAQCTYASDDGQRCGSRRFLEFDHVLPVAHGGQSTIENLRLRCRTHNQLEAECVFGSAFMQERRERSRTQHASGEPAETADGVAT